MNRRTRGGAAALVIGGVLTLSGCLLGPNLPIEGPGGGWAVVLDSRGGYHPFPEGGAVWLIGADGSPTAPIHEIGAGRDGRVLDAAPTGEEVLVLEVDLGEMGAPERWRIVRVPADRSPAEVVLTADEAVLSARYAPDGALLYVLSAGETIDVRRRSADGTRDERIATDILALLATATTSYVIGADGTLRRADGAEEALRIDCRDDLCAGLALWPDVYITISPDGRYVGLALEGERQLLAPETDDAPRLFLVDLEAEEAEFLAMPALFPSFSPDGAQIAFMAEHPDGSVWIYVREIATRATRPLGAIDAVLWIRWGRRGLLAGVERPGETYEIVRWDGAEWRTLLGRTAE